MYPDHNLKISKLSHNSHTCGTDRLTIVIRS